MAHEAILSCGRNGWAPPRENSAKSAGKAARWQSMGMIKNDCMSEEEYRLLRELIRTEFGIVLKGDRRLTLHTKISHRLGILGIRNYSEYYRYILADRSGDELNRLASHVTNNETYFFREKNQLELFAELLHDIRREKQRAGKRDLRVLSVAASTGEEAYSLNILIQESGLYAWDWDVQVVGIDIDRNALRDAERARYGKHSFRSVSDEGPVLEKYFTAESGSYVLRMGARKGVVFRHGNLLKPEAFTGLSQCDVIFCRNVLIYMSDEAIGCIVKNLYDTLSDSGFLFIGSSESLIQKTNLFWPEHRNGIIIYRKDVAKRDRGGDNSKTA